MLEGASCPCKSNVLTYWSKDLNVPTAFIVVYPGFGESMSPENRGSAPNISSMELGPRNRATFGCMGISGLLIKN